MKIKQKGRGKGCRRRRRRINQIKSNRLSLSESLRRKKFSSLNYTQKPPPPQWKIEVSSSTRLDSIRVELKTLQNLLDDCQRALQLLNLSDVDDSDRVGQWSDSPDREEELSTSESRDPETDKVMLYIPTLTIYLCFVGF